MCFFFLMFENYDVFTECLLEEKLLKNNVYSKRRKKYPDGGGVVEMLMMKRFDALTCEKG